MEIGDLFLGRGNLKPGFELPTGAVWQPRFWVYGSGRTSLQTFDQGRRGGQVSEWANRLDLFGNLQLTGTERILIGVTPLHRDASFSGQTFEPDSREGTDNELNFRIRTLFFEGDIAELFPRWDINDSTTNDIGFSIGRQEVVFQDGVLISDTIDAVGLTRNNVRFTGVPWLVNLRTTVLYAWDEIHRDDNTEDHDAQLFGLFNQIDTPFSTFNFDFVYVDSSSRSGDDVLTGAVDAVQRFGKLSTTFRVAGSYAPDLKTRTSNDGVLLFADVNWTPAYTFNIAYITAFAGFNDFTSAARDPLRAAVFRPWHRHLSFANEQPGQRCLRRGDRLSDIYGRPAPTADLGSWGTEGRHRRRVRCSRHRGASAAGGRPAHCSDT